MKKRKKKRKNVLPKCKHLTKSIVKWTSTLAVSHYFHLTAKNICGPWSVCVCETRPFDVCVFAAWPPRLSKSAQMPTIQSTKCNTVTPGLQGLVYG